MNITIAKYAELCKHSYELQEAGKIIDRWSVISDENRKLLKHSSVLTNPCAASTLEAGRKHQQATVDNSRE